jgi:hypothetical protein
MEAQFLTSRGAITGRNRLELVNISKPMTILIPTFTETGQAQN